MARIRRATAIVLDVLLVLFGAAGAGAACAERSTGMGAMTAGTMAMAHEGAAPREGGQRCPEPARDHGCSLPWAPGGCAALAACAAPAVLAEMTAAPVAAPSTDRGWSEPVLAHPGPALAPDLPPPRA